MRTAIVTLMILAIAGSAFAANLGSTSDQVKPGTIVPYDNPTEHKQGGDTIFDPTVIPGLPYNNTGTTIGYVNDYDEICPYSLSESPDVVYTFTPTDDVYVYVDLCTSAYDTKLYIYDAGLALIACDDDFHGSGGPCGDWTSRVQNVYLAAGTQYYIIVDGYGSDAGNYVFEMDLYEPCPFACPADAVNEGEGHISNGYEDTYNGGCNSGGPEFIQDIDWINVEDGNAYDGYAWLCGITGTYDASDGTPSRDTDWFRVIAQNTGMMDVVIEGGDATTLFKLFPTDCGSVAVELSTTGNCQLPATLSFPVTAGEEVWLWVGPSVFGAPVVEWKYSLFVSNLEYQVVGTEDMSFGGVKALFR